RVCRWRNILTYKNIYVLELSQKVLTTCIIDTINTNNSSVIRSAPRSRIKKLQSGVYKIGLALRVFFRLYWSRTSGLWPKRVQSFWPAFAHTSTPQRHDHPRAS